VEDADFGELKLKVEDADGFEIGMKVQVTDDQNSGCWNVSAATITDIEEDVIYIDRGLIRDYRSDQNGLVSNASSVIEIIDAEDCMVSDLLIDGNRTDNFFADGCNSAGILIYKSGWITVDGVHVMDFNGEGISWQTTEHVSILNSEISGSGNTGLHPGTGSPYTRIENNVVHHNDQDGLFICWRVYESSVKGNSFHHNGRYGICTGHKDTDVLFESNHIFENGSDGVNLRAEREANAPHRNTFTRNIIENNGTDGGGFGFSINSPARELVLTGNQFGNSLNTQKAAIYVFEAGLEPELIDNRFDLHEMGNLVMEDPRQSSLAELSDPEHMNVNYQPIGVFHSKLSPQSGAPRQGMLTPDNEGVIEVFPAYEEAVRDLESYPYIIVLYHMHLSTTWHPLVRPPSSERDFGLFATRSPNRPNSIGLGVIKLERVDGRQLYVSGIDAFDGTPVLDIKPWLPSIDCPDDRSRLPVERELGIPQ
jgi:tRNA-Thr(GGU) m(6)t(6)A37 methyltransferase TsaA